MDLQTLKTFLRVDGSEDDIVLASLIKSGNSHMKKAGVEIPEIEEEKEQYNLAIMLYVKREYDPHSGLELTRMDQSIQGIILQLRDYENEEEEE